jgi:hypothetical protein
MTRGDVSLLAASFAAVALVWLPVWLPMPHGLDAPSGSRPNPADLSSDFVTVRNESDFARLMDAERAIVFVDVDWSNYLPPSRKAASELAATLKQTSPSRDIAFFRLDMTEQSGPLSDAASAWLGPQGGASRVLTTGYGEIVWIRRGKVQDYIVNAAAHRGELLERTEAALP